RRPSSRRTGRRPPTSRSWTSRSASRSPSWKARSRPCRRPSPRSASTARSSRSWCPSSAARRRSSCPSARSPSSSRRLLPAVRTSPSRTSRTSRTRNDMPPKKKVAALIKLQIQAGAATPAPPVGPALGQHGVNIMEFVKAYNAQTESERGNVIPVEITVYEDRSFTFITKTPPAAELIKKAAGVPKGSGEPHKVKVGRLTADQVRDIARQKLED